MLGLPSGTQVWLVAGITDMRCGFNGLTGKVQTAIQQNPYNGHLFVFRGRRGDLLKVLWWTGDGLCLLAKRLERGRFHLATSRQWHRTPHSSATIHAA